MNLKNEKGGGLIMVIVVMAVLMVLATTFLMLTSVEGKQTARYNNKIQAYHYAMSGVEFAFEVLNNDYLNGNLDKGFQDGSFPAYFYGNLKEGLQDGESITENISVEIIEDELGVLVKSTGRIGNIKELISVRVPKLQGDGEGGDGTGGGRPNLPPNQGVIITGDIDLKGSAKIIGNATLGGTVYTRGSAGITGGVTNGTDLNYTMPTFPPYPDHLPIPPNISPVEHGDLLVGKKPHQQYTINDDGEYNKIQIVSNGILNIDVGEGIRIIRVKQLDIQQGQIILQGSGKLILYIEDEFETKGTINNFGEANHLLGNPQQLTVFYGGSNDVDFSGNDVFIGDIFCSSANVSIGGGASVVGNIITGGTSVDIGGGTNVKIPLLYAPNANVDVSGGASLEGIIVANTLEGSGNGEIIFKDSTEDLFPDLIWGTTDGASGDAYGSPVWGN